MVQKSDARPRGRPRGFDTADVLKAASERFRTHGFAGTSLDDLVDATGLARPSLYAAFGDKRAIYLAVLKRTYERSALGFDRFAVVDMRAQYRFSETATANFGIDNVGDLKYTLFHLHMGCHE